jgi:hypothetical protein
MLIEGPLKTDKGLWVELVLYSNKQKNIEWMRGVYEILRFNQS